MKERFERKVKRFLAELSFCSFDQLLYQGIFESLGMQQISILPAGKTGSYIKIQTYINQGLIK